MTSFQVFVVLCLAFSAICLGVIADGIFKIRDAIQKRSE